MSDPTWPTPSSLLMQWGKMWRLDGDLIRCRGCGRGINVCYFDTALNHAADCKFLSGDRPWRELADILEQSNTNPR